jgi:adenylate cyclase
MAEPADPEIAKESADSVKAAGELPAMPDAFISYASHDASIATALVEALEKAGLTCWIAPRDVRAGALYADAIVRAISGAKTFVLVLSESSIDSSHVGKEIERASSKKRPIIALRIDAAPLTPALEYFLSESQWVEAQAGNMQPAYAKLIAAVGAIGKSASFAPGADSHKSRSATAGNLRPSRVRRIGMLAAITLTAVAAAGIALLAYKVWLSKRAVPESSVTATTTAVQDKSIAVLPFTDMSEKHDQEYFSDGMAEEIIDLLVKVPELKVPARTSSFYFKGKSTKIPDIARELGVANILEGSVRKSGDHLRVTAQLVRADNGFHLWSETYDRQLDDVFKTQDEIANSVVKALKVSLLNAQVPTAQPTTNSEAYELYLRARALLRKGSHQDTLDGYADLKRAVNLDPNFALAWAALARVLGQDSNDLDEVFSSSGAGGRNSNPDISHYAETWAKTLAAAHEAANRAIALEPNSAEAHAAKAYLLGYADWEWPAADAEFAKARELDPSIAYILHDSADVNIALGRVADGLALANRAVALDPLGYGWDAVAYAQFIMGNLKEAERIMRRSIELHPDGGYYHYGLGNVLLAEGDAQGALSEFEKDSGANWRAVGAPLGLDALDRHADADRALSQAEQTYGNSMAYQIACVYARRKDLDGAFRWLERAYKQRDEGLSVLKSDPVLDNIRQDPRFKALLHKLNLPE